MDSPILNDAMRGGRSRRPAPAPAVPDDKFERLFEQSQDAILIVADDGHILDANPAASSLFRYSRDEFFGMPAEQLSATDTEHASLLPDAPARRASRFEVPLETKDGKEIIGSVSIAACRETASDESLVFCIIHDVTHTHNLRQELVNLQEDERRRIGRELHDSVGSQLIGAVIVLDRCMQQLDRGEEITKESLMRVRRDIAESTAQVRNLSHGLNPMRMGPEFLPAALDELAEQVTEQIDGTCTCQVTFRKPRPSKEQTTHLLRIAQEATANACEHADPSNIQIELTRSDVRLQLVIRDDGRGFDASAAATGGIGIASMQYRADSIGAYLEISSEPGEGTTVRCELPVDHEER